MRFLTTLIIALCVSLAASACAKKEGADGKASCEKLGVHFSELARQEADSLPEGHAEKKAAMAEIALLPKASASLVKECRDEKWSATIRTCFLDAKSAADFTKNCKALLERQGRAGGNVAPMAAPKKAEPPNAEPPKADPAAKADSSAK